MASDASVAERTSTLTVMGLLPAAAGRELRSFAESSVRSVRTATTVVFERARRLVTMPLPMPRNYGKSAHVRMIIYMTGGGK
jgi:hypothetical protein